MPAAGVICCYQDIHVRELIGRIRWALKLRWLFVGGCFGLSVPGFVPLVDIDLNPWYPFGAGCFLIAMNLLYRQQIIYSNVSCAGTHELRLLSLTQLLGDYVALAIIVYSMGSIETPIMFMAIPNIIFATIFFTRRQSFLITTMGFGMVVLPFLLEVAGLIPSVTLFAGGIKEAMLANSSMLLLYFVVLYISLFCCWYLAGVLTASLIKNELGLEQNYQAMIQLDEEKTQATLRGTHELKAPLAAIKSYTYTLRDGYAGELPERALDVVKRIADRCDRLLAKITDIIRLGNIKSYVYTGSQYEALDLVAALTEMVGEIEEIGRQRNIKIDFRIRDLSDEKLLVTATREHLQMLFRNLLSNAVNYSKPEGVVTITLQPLKQQVEVTVEDHGIGIAEDDQHRVFDDHFRTTNAANHHVDGTGLGLSIVRAVAKLLGAEIELQSELGEGTTFKVVMPICQ